MPVVKLRQDAIRGLSYVGRHEKHQCIYWETLRYYVTAITCRRAAIPTPTRGYWGRVESGQRIDRTPLPAAPEGLPTLLRI
ncbi:MAG: hypothetical protein QOF42_2824 [Gammaproteobacteria bacterium]|jgi:hypothetical protein|nr:hypothetical protein [Gammaproteobacteria bacterium]